MLKSARLRKRKRRHRISCAENLSIKFSPRQSGFEISDERELMSTLRDLPKPRKKYRRVKNALDEVEATGYGIVMPDVEEMVLAEPGNNETGGQYGVRLRPRLPSIHMMKAKIKTKLAPVVGSGKSSRRTLSNTSLRDLRTIRLKYGTQHFRKIPSRPCKQGLHESLQKMPPDARGKVRNHRACDKRGLQRSYLHNFITLNSGRRLRR